MPYKLFFIISSCLVFSSCDQILSSIAKEKIKSNQIKDSLELAFNESPIDQSKNTILEKKTIGLDSFFLIQRYYLTGEKYSEGWRDVDGTLHGICKFYFPNGKLQNIIEYNHGYAHDLITSYDSKGNLLNESTLKNGNGRLCIRHPFTNNIVSVVNFKNGVKHGVLNVFFSDGPPKVIANFKNDTFIRSYFIYYHSGKIKELWTKSIDELTVTYKSFYKTGNELRNEIWVNNTNIATKEFDINGSLVIEGKTKNNIYIEDSLLYSDSNHLVEKRHFINHIKEGVSERYYESGKKKSESVFKNDTLVYEVYWHESGKTLSKGNYKDGLFNGLYIEYYPTGNKKLEQFYVNGLKHGKYMSYFNSGKIYNIGTFSNNELVDKLEFYNEKGDLIRTKIYK